MNGWVKLGVLVAAVAVAAVALRPGPAQVKRGRPAPPLALPAVGGGTVDLASLRGRVVAVNFWATWCGPCRMEMPELADVWRRNHDRCFELLGVAEESDRADVDRVARTVPYPILVDARAAVATAWKVPGYPQTYLVDPEGRLARTFQGALTGRELEDAIRPLLPATCAAR